MNAVFLHLSDIHFRAENDPIVGKSEVVGQFLYRFLPNADCVFVVISGDIAYSGQENEYQIALAFLTDLIEVIRAEKVVPVFVVPSPGNHDCDFGAEGSIRNIVIDSVRKNGVLSITDEIIDVCTAVNKNYREFVSQLPSPTRTFKSPLWDQFEYRVGEYRIVFDSINVSWMSTLDEKQGALHFPIDRFESQLNVSADLRVAVMHHPLNWYGQTTYHKFREALKSREHIVLSGHEHVFSAYEVDDSRAQQSTFIEAPALQASSLDEKQGFVILVCDMASSQYLVNRFCMQGSTYVPEELTESWKSYRKLRKGKGAPALTITDEFLQVLDDPGANYQHIAIGEVRLSDIYVFPDLEDIRARKSRRILKSAQTLLTLDDSGTRVVIVGDEQSGKSALFRMLYRQYHDSGEYPLFVDAHTIKRATEDEFSKIVRASLLSQYGSKSTDAWLNLPKRKKVLLLDDFDRSRVSDRYRGRILDLALKQFGHVLVSAGAAQSVKDLVSESSADAFADFSEYFIAPFGYRLRYDLITKWQSLGQDFTLGARELIERIDEAEKLIDRVIGANVVPRTPFYLLTLLQSHDDTSGPDLASSAFGYYYNYLIVGALKAQNFPLDQLNEIFNYCANLAWHFHSIGEMEISEAQLRGFNGRFSEQYFQIDFAARRDLLVRAKLMRKHGDTYSFSYKYIYFYFLGMYIGQNIGEEDGLKDLVRDYCSKLQVSYNANTMLFLAHHCRDNVVIDEIVRALRAVFHGEQRLAFESDVVRVNELVNSTVRIILEDGDPIARRRESRKLQDDLDRDLGGKELEDADHADDFTRQVEALFRTVDILGQILKNYYGNLKNRRKVELMKEIYDAPLRALRSLFDSVHEFQESIVRDIEKGADESNGAHSKEDLEKIAKRIAFEMVAVISFVFLNHASSSVGSKFLVETSNSLVKKEKSLAYELMQLGTRLDTAATIPISSLREIARKSEGNMLVQRLLEILAVRHVYYFKTSVAEKQALTDILGISIQKQRQIDEITKNKKLES